MSIEKEKPVKPYLRRPFTCDACGTSFKHKKNVLTHIQKHNENSTVGGEISYHINNKVYSKKGDDLRPYTCEICSKSFKQKHHLHEHTLYVHSKARPFSCNECDLTFKQTRDLRLHEARVHNRRQVFRCSECGLSCEQRHFLRAHIERVHENDKNVTIVRCMTSSSHENKSARVQKKKKKNKKKKVVPVVKTKENDTTLQTDKKVAIEDDEEVIEIDEVIIIQDDNEVADRNENVIAAPMAEEVAVQNKREAQVQSRQHIPYSCKECYAQFRLKMHLREHMISVHGRKVKRKVRLVSCDGCGESFKQKRTLEKHFSQSQCGGRLSADKTEKEMPNAKRSLKKPPSSRDGQTPKRKIVAAAGRHSSDAERPYRCEQCGNSFKQAGHLYEHSMYVHADGLSFSCSVCDKTFKRARSLRLHMVGVHRMSVPYICRECGQTFKSVLHLRTHSRTMHMERTLLRESLHLKKSIGPSQTNSDRPFHCGRCDATFRLSVSLSRHYVKEHANENEAVRVDEFGNDSAGGSFQNGRRKSSSVGNFQADEYDPTIACPSCSELFDDYFALREHAAICEKHAVSMAVHEKRMGFEHARREYECIVCDIRFQRATLLDLHLREVHDSMFFFHWCANFSCTQTFHLSMN